MKYNNLKYYLCTINERKKLTMIATRIDQIRERRENTPVKMADVALKVTLAFVHFLLLPLYKQSAFTTSALARAYFTRIIKDFLYLLEEENSLATHVSLYANQGQ